MIANVAQNPLQTNTKPGTGMDVIALETSSGSANKLGVLVDDSGVLSVRLPDAVSDIANVLINEAMTDGASVNVSHIQGEGNFRARLQSTCSAGDTLVLAAINGTDDGKVIALPATEGIYWSPGIAEEDGVDEQDVLIRPQPRLVVVGEAFTVAAPAATAATNSTPFGFAEAQANAILTNVIEMRAFMVAMGWKATS